MGTDLSTFLFARPSFLSGAARVLDIGGTLTAFNQSRSPEEADARAIEADFRAVGADLRAAAAAVVPDGDAPAR